MPRKGPAPRRPLVADPVYNSPLVTQLVNKILLRGKRQLAERIVYGALEGCREKSRHRPGRHPQAGDGQREADPRGAQPPCRWRDLPGAGRGAPAAADHAGPALAGARTRKARREKTMVERLMNELLDASNGLGAAVKRREDTHKMAESNKAFAHYRW